RTGGACHKTGARRSDRSDFPGPRLPRHAAPVRRHRAGRYRQDADTAADIPGGQILGPTFDYTHRLLDPQLAESSAPELPARSETPSAAMPRVTDILGRDGLIESSPAAE